MTPPSLGRVYIALPWSPKFVKQCIVDLSMSELSGFADADDILFVACCNACSAAIQHDVIPSKIYSKIELEIFIQVGILPCPGKLL